MRYKIIFLDADGTLWNFKEKDKSDKLRTLKEAALDNGALGLLKKLKARKSNIILLTYQPYKSRVYSRSKIRAWLRYFGILSYFNEIHISDKENHTKEKIITRVLKHEGIRKSEVTMIGDRYKWDYLPAKAAGIRAFLLKKPENKKHRIKTYTFAEIGKLI